jgi:hypothetical protein
MYLITIYKVIINRGMPAEFLFLTIDIFFFFNFLSLLGYLGHVVTLEIIILGAPLTSFLMTNHNIFELVLIGAQGTLEVFLFCFWGPWPCKPCDDES